MGENKNAKANYAIWIILCLLLNMEANGEVVMLFGT